MSIMRTHSSGHEKLERLIDAGLQIMCMDEPYSLAAFEQLICSIVFGVTEGTLAMTDQIAMINAPRHLQALMDFSVAHAEKITFVHSIPATMLDVYALDMSNQGTKLLSSYLRVAARG
jgi:hypothetical protein